MVSKAYPKRSTAYPRSPPTRRGPLIICLVGAVIFFTIFFSTSSSNASSTATGAAKFIPSLPRPHNPFRPPVHEPPIQRNSTSGEAKWFNDWKWLNPFSSSITLDENRSVLPPLHTRPPIYTFYDADVEKTEAVRTAENRLLLIWRRAWWAQGFKPVILGRAEALSNPHYENLQGKKLNSGLEAELVRWLAWGHMGSGILVNWLVLPMGFYDDHLLSYLRRGQYPQLTRYESLGSGIYSGDQNSVDLAIANVLRSRKLQTAKSIVEATSDPDMFAVDPKPSDIAFYDPAALTNLYKPVADALLANQAQGLTFLSNLISAHLHATFLNNFPSGIAVLSPHVPRCTILSTAALALAHSLNTCADSPVPHSCPPNTPNCTPCTSLNLSYPGWLSNNTSLFTIGTVPHPYTLALLLAKKPEVTVRHIRRDTDRDRWLQLVTQDTLGTKLGGAGRIVHFKDTVAGELSAPRSIWVTAEQDLQWQDLEWHFGFRLPRANTSAEDVLSSATPAQMKPLLDTMKPKQPATDVLADQAVFLNKGKEKVNRKSETRILDDMQEVVEAWNLADTEAWRFVRSYEARERVERQRWEEEERAFVGSEGNVRGEGWGRWFDHA